MFPTSVTIEAVAADAGVAIEGKEVKCSYLDNFYVVLWLDGDEDIAQALFSEGVVDAKGVGMFRESTLVELRSAFPSLNGYQATMLQKKLGSL